MTEKIEPIEKRNSEALNVVNGRKTKPAELKETEYGNSKKSK